MLLTDELADIVNRTFIASMKRATEAAKQVEPSSTYADLNGGLATFAGEGSPFTQVPVLAYKNSEANLDEIEEFYRGRATNWEMNISPYTSPHLFPLMAERGYAVDHFETILVMEVPPNRQPRQVPEGVKIEVIEGLSEEWLQTSADGWGEPAENTTSRIMSVIPDTRRYLARVDGKAAAIGAMTFFDELVVFAGGATLPKFRGRGIQRALYERRMLDAGAGSLVTVTCIPGTSSHRNAQRVGFSPIYSNLVVTRRPAQDAKGLPDSSLSSAS